MRSNCLAWSLGLRLLIHVVMMTRINLICQIEACAKCYENPVEGHFAQINTQGCEVGWQGRGI